MSTATVRHHLGILVADGRVLAGKGAVRPKRGRPEKSYRLSERVLGENFDLLADALLVTLFEKLSQAEQQAAIRQVGDRLNEWVGSIDAGLPAPKRLVQLTQRLSTLHYEAGWEAGAQGPRVLLGHCPYAAIIARHPELCKMDAQLLSTHMNAPVEQLSKIDQRPGGASHCVFAIGGRGK